MANDRMGVRGFTLIELMVTISIAVVLMAVVVPSLTTFQRNAQLTSFTNTLVASLNAARGEAMKRGRYAMVVPKDGASWDSGWYVFVDMDRSQDYLDTADLTLLTSDAKPGYISVEGNGNATGSTPYLMFDASGYSKLKNGAFSSINLTLEIKRNDVSSTEELRQTRRIKIARTGRVRVCTPTSATDSLCSPLPASTGS